LLVVLKCLLGLLLTDDFSILNASDNFVTRLPENKGDGGWRVAENVARMVVGRGLEGNRERDEDGGGLEWCL